MIFTSDNSTTNCNHFINSNSLFVYFLYGVGIQLFIVYISIDITTVPFYPNITYNKKILTLKMHTSVNVEMKGTDKI